MNAITVIPRPQAPDFTLPEVYQIAQTIAAGKLFGSTDVEAVMTLCLLAHAEGLHPVAVMRDYHMIQGKPSKKAEAMQRDFLAAGGRIVWNKLDDTCADATFSHPAGGEARIDWDIKRATAAGLMGNPMWKKYPRQMLKARVISEGARTVFPGATSGLYVPEEIMDFNEPRNAATANEAPALTAPQEPQEAQEKVAWPEGPYSSKTKLLTAWKGLVHDLNGADSAEAVEALIDDAEPLLKQFRRAAKIGFADMEQQYRGDGGDFKGVMETLSDARAHGAMMDMNRDHGGEGVPYEPQSIIAAG